MWGQSYHISNEAGKCVAILDVYMWCGDRED